LQDSSGANSSSNNEGTNHVVQARRTARIVLT
jgi:hypothetical protein